MSMFVNVISTLKLLNNVFVNNTRMFVKYLSKIMKNAVTKLTLF